MGLNDKKDFKEFMKRAVDRYELVGIDLDRLQAKQCGSIEQVGTTAVFLN